MNDMTESGKGAPKCRDCQHVKPDTGPISLFGLLPWKWEFARCGRTMHPEPLNPGSTPDAVIHRHPLVGVERAITFHACGPAARHFEPRRAS
ncbi:hypothetical protein CFB47_07425 [Burkholderia sp. AU27893]|uniref:Uncharacterized protein n=1 Tax=Burkholderia contaminans TaxID=488447 RepID=A0A2S5DRH5_9BURK|nr:hypothetical protein CFB47_07425 [Burkholderia sp. AU27893]POZ81677.1 hypothetical protein C3743_15275 [Burkholderia contaminans]